MYPECGANWASAEGWFVKAPELSRMQLAYIAPELLDRLEADQQMLADRPVVERVRRPR
jgi:hypothetical protein